MAAADSTPRLSVVIAVRVATPALAGTLEALAAQDGFAACEVLLADGSGGEEARAAAAPFAAVRHLRLPPLPLPRLKAAAMAAARGELLALLEASDRPEPGWVRAILDGFPPPPAVAMGGGVLPGGPATAANLGAYLFEYGAFAPPLAAGPTRGELPGNNLAYRQAGLRAACADLLPGGFWKPFFQERLRASGGTFHVNPAMVVRHLTDHRLVPFCRSRFHHGRCFGAMRRQQAPAGRKLLYVASAPLVPALLLLRHLHRAVGHPGTRPLLGRGMLALALVCLAWGAGEWLGCWLGPGRSCQRVY